MSMPIKHEFGKLKDGDALVTFVEKNTSEARKDFLKNLLEHNNFEVLVEENEAKEEGAENTYTVAVTDLIFNPVIWVYDRKLLTTDGKIVNEDYWMQRNEDFVPQYWER